MIVELNVQAASIWPQSDASVILIYPYICPLIFGSLSSFIMDLFPFLTVIIVSLTVTNLTVTNFIVIIANN